MTGKFPLRRFVGILRPEPQVDRVVRDETDSSKLLVGEMQLDRPEDSLSALVRRQVEQRIDRRGWQE